eukprot:1355415-Lingulodinium_polyedra.AAC.1
MRSVEAAKRVFDRVVVQRFANTLRSDAVERAFCRFSAAQCAEAASSAGAQAAPKAAPKQQLYSSAKPAPK